MEMYQLYAIRKNSKIVYVGYTKESKGYLKRFQEHLKAKDDGALIHAGRNDKEYSVSLLLHNILDGNGMNMTYGGEGVIGHVHTENTIEKMKVATKKFWKELKNTPEDYIDFCMKRGQKLKGVSKSFIHRKHLSEVRKGRFKGMDNPFYDRHHSDEAKKRISEANSKEILMIDIQSNEVLKKFDSLKDAQNWCIQQGITSNNSCGSRISKICNGIDKTAYGYIWKYK